MPLDPDVWNARRRQRYASDAAYRKAVLDQKARRYREDPAYRLASINYQRQLLGLPPRTLDGLAPVGKRRRDDKGRYAP